MKTIYKIGDVLFFLEEWGISNSTVTEITIKGFQVYYHFLDGSRDRPESAVGYNKEDLICKLK